MHQAVEVQFLTGLISYAAAVTIAYTFLNTERKEGQRIENISQTVGMSSRALCTTQ